MVTVSYKRGSMRPIKTKFVKNALATPTVPVDQISHSLQDQWKQIDLVNPMDTNLVVVAGLAEHPTLKMNETFFWYHQFALCIEGEMVVQDLANGKVYRAHDGDLYYWAPGHRMMLGGKFKAFYVKTPIPSRWVNTHNGKQGVPMQELINETTFPASLPSEVKKVRPWPSGAPAMPRMKLVKGATKARPTATSGGTDDWRQVELINALDSDLTAVAGVVKVNSKGEFACYHRSHRVTVVLDGQAVNEDADTGEVYRGEKGDLFYWPPGLRHRLSGKFSAYFVETPITSRWVKGPKGVKRLNLTDLKGEIVRKASPPDEVMKGRLERA